jgi:hypothetical protein
MDSAGEVLPLPLRNRRASLRVAGGHQRVGLNNAEERLDKGMPTFNSISSSALSQYGPIAQHQRRRDSAQAGQQRIECALRVNHKRADETGTCAEQIAARAEQRRIVVSALLRAQRERPKRIGRVGGDGPQSGDKGDGLHVHDNQRQGAAANSPERPRTSGRATAAYCRLSDDKRGACLSSLSKSGAPARGSNTTASVTVVSAETCGRRRAVSSSSVGVMVTENERSRGPAADRNPRAAAMYQPRPDMLSANGNHRRSSTPIASLAGSSRSATSRSTTDGTCFAFTPSFGRQSDWCKKVRGVDASS